MTSKTQRRRLRKATKSARGKVEKAIEDVAEKPANEPTPERRARGSYAVGTGRRIWQDQDATPLRRALRLGKLDQRQVDAGEWLEGLLRALNGSPGQRSCLDDTPRGSNESEGEFMSRRADDWKAVRRRLTTYQRNVLWEVCFWHDPIGDMRPAYRRFSALAEGLTAVADYTAPVRKAA